MRNTERRLGLGSKGQMESQTWTQSQMLTLSLSFSLSSLIRPPPHFSLAALVLLHLCVSLLLFPAPPPLFAPPFLPPRVIPGDPWSATTPCRASCPGETSPVPSPTDPASTPTSAGSPSGFMTPSSPTHESPRGLALRVPCPPASPQPCRDLTLRAHLHVEDIHLQPPESPGIEAFLLRQ